MSTQVGRVFPVWFDGEIIKLIRCKERYYAKYKRSRSTYWHDKYSDTRKTVKHKIGKAHSDYIEGVQHTLKSDPKYFWTYMKSLRGNVDIPGELNFNNESFRGAKDISEGFAKFFKSVFSPTDNAVEGSLASGGYVDENLITKEEITEALKKLECDRAIGPDGILDYVIKGCGEFLVEPLVQIFNLSLRTATYPKVWRNSKVVPVFKSGSKN